MKNEPLKDKIWYTQGDIYSEPKPKPLDLIEHKVVVYRNLKLAIEWLKEFFEDKERYNAEYVKCKIDEAFEEKINSKTKKSSN